MRTRRLAETDEQRIYDKCDRTYPKLRYGRCCLACLAAWKVTPADAIRLIVQTDNPLARFDLNNMVPLCKEHAQDPITKIPVSSDTVVFLEHQAKRSFNGVCIAKGKTRAQALLEMYNKIKDEIL